MLITRTEVKALINKLNNSQYDTAIDLMIPIIENEIAEICNNHFIKQPVTGLINIPYQEYAYGYSSNISFIFDAATRTITLEGVEFLSYGFQANSNIYIEGTYNNNGHFSLSNTTDSVLTVNSLYTITDENQPTITNIYIVNWPVGLKIIAAKMIAYQILYANTKGVSSESVGDYSVSYINNNAQYSPEIMKSLYRYKIPKAV